MDEENWILCPVCGNKTRLKIRKDTELADCHPKRPPVPYSAATL